MKAKQLRNGSLYEDTESGKIVRVLGKVNSQRVWTTQHEERPQATKSKILELASDAQVTNYLNVSKAIKDDDGIPYSLE
jgi:hypothetical protein